MQASIPKCILITEANAPYKTSTLEIETDGERGTERLERDMERETESQRENQAQRNTPGYKPVHVHPVGSWWNNGFINNVENLKSTNANIPNRGKLL